MPSERLFVGGVFSEQLDGGRAGAELWGEPSAIHARTHAGALFSIPAAECQIERGGASGDVWFCRSRDRRLTLFSEAPGFADLLRHHPTRELAAQVAQIEQAARRGRRRRGVLLASLLAVCVLFVTSGVYLLRWAARSAVDALPTTVDRSLGDLAIEHMDLEGPVLEEPVVRAAVERIVDELARAEPGEFAFRVRVIEAPIKNAFALPGGPIVVYTGLLRAAAGPEQVAGVIAHEMAHVTERHGMRRIAQSIGVVATLQLLLGDVSGLAALAVELFQVGAVNHYSREQEREADAEGARRMARARLDPRALATFFKVLRASEPSATQLPDWLATHPDLEERIAEVNALAAKLAPKAPRKLELGWSDVRARLEKVEPPTVTNLDR